MTAATATKSRTEGQCANGADIVTMTPTATAIVQTALALTTTVTTVGTAAEATQQHYGSAATKIK